MGILFALHTRFSLLGKNPLHCIFEFFFETRQSFFRRGFN